MAEPEMDPERRLRMLEAEVSNLNYAMFGLDGTNGMRSEVKAMRGEVKDLDAKMDELPGKLLALVGKTILGAATLAGLVVGVISQL